MCVAPACTQLCPPLRALSIRAATEIEPGVITDVIPASAPMRSKTRPPSFASSRRARSRTMKKMLAWRLGLLTAVAVTGAAIAHGTPAKSRIARPQVTIRVDDKRISRPAHVPAGLVDVHIVTSGKVHHHLAFWHLNQGITKERFLRELKRENGDPFKIATCIGGNGPMLAGSVTSTMRMVPGTVVLADIVDGPTTEIASFDVSGAPVSMTPPHALGTIVNQGFRF